MKRNRRFPKTTFGDLDSPLSELQKNLASSKNFPTKNGNGASGALTEANQQKKQPATKSAKVDLPVGKKYKLKPQYEERFALRLPDPDPDPSQEIRKKAAITVTPAQEAPKLTTHKRNTSEQQHRDIFAERRQAADQIRSVVDNRVSIVEQSPKSISDVGRRQIDKAILAGQQIWHDRPTPDPEGYIVGLDFGTSTTKVAYRQPYVAGDPIAVIPVPKQLRSASHPGLWQTALWFDTKKSMFSLYPVASSIPLVGFKAGLVKQSGLEPLKQMPTVSRACAAAAFLTMQLSYILGIYEIDRPLGTAGASHYWLINIGVPVAIRDDGPALERFTKIVSAACALIPHANKLTLNDVKAELAIANPVLPKGFGLVPELTAAIAGYSADPLVQTGAHLLVDVGSSTLDIVAFYLKSKLDASVFTAGVDLFGAGALEVVKSAKVNDSIFEMACNYLFYEVYGMAKNEKRAASLFKPGSRNNPVQLVITGGGCDTDLHARFINQMLKDSVLGNIPLSRPAPPAKILPKNCDQSRLLLAYGLTRDREELARLRLPSQIEDIELIQVSPISHIGKDDV
ncbi:hypothetical protein HUO14_14560 [Parasphingorhabdus flavimaris]|uniref:Actin-like ATPase domain-containing protein n=1 Tax=Parasphingorhabdus flavimaris TaxID=266812 RepID=A0ABX2N5Y0_9SPHN|nr:hypothetical protein [Parasphingorhabdus flavimaris]NVD29118.1 hypothetical protein [Parasphingorhabdus flavimaris]